MEKSPPEWIGKFLRWFCNQELLEEIEGDTRELYSERLRDEGKWMAEFKYLRDILRFFRISNFKNSHQNKRSNQNLIAMFQNFLITARRSFLKHRSYFLINVTGLAVGIASVLFISIYVFNESSYDQFHTQSKNIFRVNSKAIIRGKPSSNTANTPPFIGKIMMDLYPEVIAATRIFDPGQMVIGNGSGKIIEDQILFGDSSFFKVFDFELIKGNPATALIHPRTMIISERYASKYFGKDNPVGKHLSVESDTVHYEITGVFADIPANSHIQFDLMGSVISNPEWNQNRWVSSSGNHNYIILDDPAKQKVLEEKFEEIVYQYLAPEIEYYTGLKISEWEGAGNHAYYDLIPITNIYLNSDSTGELAPTGNRIYIYIYGLIALIILSMGLFNFINLATAHSTTRAREVSIRKVIGSSRRQLIIQFVFESVLIAFVASIAGLLLVVGSWEYFIELVGKDVNIDQLTGPIGWIVFGSFVIGIGVLAGIYPSIILSRFKPVLVLKGTHSQGAKTGWLRNLLVTLQFAASMVIIIVTYVIYDQIDFMLSKNLGFSKEQVLVIQRPEGLGKNYEVFEKSLLTNPDVRMVTNSQTIPGKNYELRSYRKKDDTETYLFKSNLVNYNYQELMGLELVKGRFFSKTHSSDSIGVVINEAAAKAFGFEDPIGQKLTSAFRKGEILTIIGVIKDYNISSLHKAIEPVSMELFPAYQNGYISIKLASDQNIRETVSFIDRQWDRYTTDEPFQYFFYDNEYQQLYKAETSTGRILTVFASLSVFIACIGLIGLITFSSSIRRKEIGIRKVLGASILKLVVLLSSNVGKLLFISIILAWPLAYFSSQYWLQNFASRVVFNPLACVYSALLMITVIGLSIGYQTYRASIRNPADSLRQE